jgi:hypothetical protein
LPTRFYLHRGLSPNGGVLPASRSSLSTTAPTWTPGLTNTIAFTPYLYNRTMDATIGTSAQTSLAYATDNVTTNQRQPLICFVSSPLAAQTISAQALTLRVGFSQSNTISAFTLQCVIAVWRPSTGVLVGRIHDGPTSAISSSAATTAQTDLSLNIASGNTTSVTAQSGDVLVVEIWRGSGLQTMGTTYNNTIFYDGTTEGSTSNNAAYLNFTNNVTLETVTPTIATRDITEGQAGTSPWTIVLPPGTVVGDQLIVVHGSSNITPVAAPLGWTRDYQASAAGHYCAVYSAIYSAGLTLTFPANISTISNWMCGAYYHQDGGRLQIGNLVGVSKLAANTSLPTGAPTTGTSAGEYEVLAYGFAIDSGAEATITPQSGSTIDHTYCQSFAPNSSVALGHNNTVSLLASTTVTAFTQTLSTAATDTDGVGILLKKRVPPAVPTDTYGALVYNSPNLVNYWRLDETSGPMIDYKGTVDLSVGTNITRGVATPIAGPKTGIKLPEAGGTERLYGLGNFSTPTGTSFAFEMWFMLPASVTATAAYVAGSNVSNIFGWWLQTNSACTAMTFAVAGGTAITSTGWTFTRDVWHHALIRYDGTTATLYLNGVSAASAAKTNNNTIGEIALGNLSDSPGGSWRGLLDEAAWYFGTTNATMAAEHYAAGFVSMPTTALAGPADAFN